MDRIEKALQRSRADRRKDDAERVAPQEAVAGVATRGNVTALAAGVESPVRTRRVLADLSAVAQAGLLRPGIVGPTAHGMKMLRAMVMQRMSKHGWNSLAIVSAAPQDGRTFIAANLAIAIAGESDHTALLVDLDLRAPQVHQRFGIEPEVGVEDCLNGRCPVSAALVALENYPGLVLLPGHAPVVNSSELLGRQRARALFRELKDRYVNRVVIYDLPPMLSGDDTLVVAPQADAVLVVVGDNSTRRADLMRCLEMLRHVPVLGTVLNSSLDAGDAAQVARP